jgi:hypothetical protein
VFIQREGLAMTRIALLLLSTAMLSGCLGNGGTGTPGAGGGPPPGASLPITGSGNILAVVLPATTTSDTNSTTGLPQFGIDSIDGTVPTDQTSPGGATFTATASEDPNPAPNFGNQAFGNVVLAAALVSASSPDQLAGGTPINGMTDAQGRVYFENGNFGDPQVESATAGASTVSVYNPPQGAQIVLSDVTTIRYREQAGSGSALFGVGYIGNATQTMPSGSTVTYRAFFEGGTAVYDNGTGPKRMYIVGDPSIVANLDTGKVTGGISNASLRRFDSATSVEIQLNTDVENLELDGTITGNEYAGTATFTDSGNNPVGTQTSEMIGGFFGAGAANTALALQNTGTMPLEGASATYTFQGVMGGSQ